MIANIIPTARMELRTICWRIVRKLLHLRKLEFMMVKIAHIAMVARRTMNSLLYLSNNCFTLISSYSIVKHLVAALKFVAVEFFVDMAFAHDDDPV